MRTLLSSPTANPKLAKGQSLGVLSAPLHLAPASLSGWNVCPMSTEGCRAACLHTSGNPLHMRGKDKARKERTAFYFTDRPAFMTQLAKEIAAHERLAIRLKMRPAIRLNATSDIPWHRIPYLHHANIMAAFPKVTFYDYTKVHKRFAEPLPRNYRLTYSWSEKPDAWAIAQVVLDMGGNVAVPFMLNPSATLPKQWRGYRVLDGDEHDFRPFDKKGRIVGLRVKGRAGKADNSGFIVKL